MLIKIRITAWIVLWVILQNTLLSHRLSIVKCDSINIHNYNYHIILYKTSVVIGVEWHHSYHSTIQQLSSLFCTVLYIMLIVMIIISVEYTYSMIFI